MLQELPIKILALDCPSHQHQELSILGIGSLVQAITLAELQLKGLPFGGTIMLRNVGANFE